MNIHYQIIGHRGDKANHTENTLAGFKSTLEADGVDGFELDVVVTKDKELIIAHDRFIKDQVKRNHFIHNLTYIELLKLSHTIYGKMSPEETRYPLLEDVFRLYTKQPHKKTILLEIKSAPSSDILPLSISQLIKKIHALLDKYSILDTCYIISFDHRIIDESYKQNSRFKIGQILSGNLIPLLPIVRALNLSLLIMNKSWITKEQVLEMHEEDIDIYVWTANTEKEWKKLNTLGVKGVITDHPKALSRFKLIP